jgi:glycosyltransferase involved in cell wall biosynthesis
MYRLHRLLANRRVAVVNVHYPTLSSVVFGFMRSLGLLRARLVVSFHGQDAVLAARLRGFQRWAFRTLLAKADAITACSRGFADEVRRLFPDECSVVDVIYNGIDPELMEHEISSALALNVNPWPRPYILCVSSFVAKKALEILVQAFVRIRKERPEYHLVIAGRSGPDLERITSLIEREDLGNHVHVQVDVPHSTVALMMRDAALFVLPSRQEPFGIVLLEAGIAKLPVVATSVGGVPEVISSPDYGVLVPPDDAHALTRSVLHLLNDKGMATRLGEQLSDHVRRSFSARATAARYLQVSFRSD